MIKANSSWLTFEPNKDLEINTSILLNLDFANNTISSCFFFFFLIIDFYFLIPAVIARIFNTITELIIRLGIPIKEVKGEMEAFPVIVKIKIRKCSL